MLRVLLDVINRRTFLGESVGLVGERLLQVFLAGDMLVLLHADDVDLLQKFQVFRAVHCREHDVTWLFDDHFWVRCGSVIRLLVDIDLIVDLPFGFTKVLLEP